ncbi:MAG TPA: TIR domain-containing protein [Verrucomicrobiae bacterium]|nr:TIR domain-containing protein [Verrucomicrobiae bacterium]
MAARNPVRAYISYSNRDRELMEELVRHLQPLMNEGLLALDYDLVSLKPGDDFTAELPRLLSEASIALFLVSPDSVSSRYVQQETELAISQQQSKVIIPIVLRPCDWFQSPLAKYNALPTMAKPVTTWDNRDEAFEDIVRGLRRVVEAPLGTREAGELPAKHDGPVYAVAVTPDGRLVLSGGADGMAIVWDGLTLKPAGVLAGHGRRPIFDLEVSPDGKLAVTASGDGTVTVWDLARYRALRLLEGHDGDVTAVSFTENGRKLVSGSSDSSIKLWDLETGQISSNATADGPVNDLVVMAGRGLAVVALDAELSVWDLGSAQKIRSFPLGAIGLCALPDGSRVIAWKNDGFVIRDIDGGQIISTVNAPRMEALSVLPGGRQAVSGHPDGLKVWDLASGTMVRSVNLGNEVPTELAVTPDGARVICGLRRGGISAWPIDLSVTRALPAGRDRLRLAYLAVIESPELWRVLESWDEAALSGIGAQLRIPSDQDVLETLAARHPNTAPPPLWAAWVETLYSSKLGKRPDAA